MRVAIAIQPFGRIGGGERLSVLHAFGLAERGHDITFYTDISQFNEIWPDDIPRFAKVRNLPYGLNREGLRELAKFDRIVIHHHIDPVSALKIAWRYGSKTIWYGGGPPRELWESYFTGRDYRELSPTLISTAAQFYGLIGRAAVWGSLYDLTSHVLRTVDRITVDRYRRIVANSNYAAELTRRVYKYNRPITIAYPCAFVDPVQNPIYGSGKFVLSVGALVPNKNHEAIIRAFALLRTETSLVIAGEGPLRGFLGGLAERLGVRVEFRPHLSKNELARTYNDCLFAVVSSLSESFGMTSVEAALAGKPSVATDFGGTKEFVLDGKCGIVVDPRQPENIAKAMNELLNNDPLRAMLGENARNRALAEFSFEHSVESLAKALE